MSSKADRLLESLASADGGHDDKESREIWNTLESTGCYQFVKTQIEEVSNSDFSSKLSSRHDAAMGFLRGSVYGYVYGKIGDRQFAVKASDFAVKAATKGKAGYEVDK